MLQHNFQVEKRHYWDCAKRRHGLRTANGCKARLITDVENNRHKIVSAGKTEHNHEANPIDGEEKNYRSTLKRKAVETNDVPAVIISNASAESPIEVQPRMTAKAQKLMIYRARESSTGGEKIQEVDGKFVIPDSLKNTLDGRSFFQKQLKEADLHILMFTTAQNIKLLECAEFWIADGTFATVPLAFNQLFSIHASVGQGDSRRVVPLVYFLLNKKNQEIYTSALECLLDFAAELNANLKPRFVLLDFEKASINAFKEVLPETEISGCYFHFTQSLLRQLGALGMKTAYGQNIKLFMAVKRLQALSFLPAVRIAEAYCTIKESLKEVLGGPFITYFEATYIYGKNRNGRPLFHPSLWSNHNVVNNNVPKSNNYQEAWHRRWEVLVGPGHLGMTKMVKELIKEQNVTEGIVLCVLQGTLSSQSTAENLELEANIRKKVSAVGSLTNIAFIDGMALVLASKSKRS